MNKCLIKYLLTITLCTSLMIHLSIHKSFITFENSLTDVSHFARISKSNVKKIIGNHKQYQLHIAK